MESKAELLNNRIDKIEALKLDVPTEIATIKSELGNLLNDPFSYIKEAYKNWGLVVEDNDYSSALLIYVCLTSRLFDLTKASRGIHCFLEAPASTGKNAFYDCNLDMFTEEVDYHKVDAGSPRVVVWSDEDFTAMSLIFTEQNSIAKDGVPASVVRNAMDTGRLKYELSHPEKGTGKMTSTLYNKGVANILTTGLENSELQKESRMLTRKLEDNNHLNIQILRMKSKKQQGLLPKIDYRKLKLFQHYLAFIFPENIEVDYHDSLLDLIDPTVHKQNKFKRQGQYILTIIQTVALINSANREWKGKTLVADIEDYTVAYEILNPIFEVMSSFGVTESLKRYYEAVEELEDELDDPNDNSLKNSISQIAISNVVGVAKSTASEQLKKLEKLGFVEDIGIGQRKNYRIGSNLKMKIGLPTPDNFKEYLATIVSKKQEDSPIPQKEPNNRTPITIKQSKTPSQFGSKGSSENGGYTLDVD